MTTVGLGDGHSAWVQVPRQLNQARHGLVCLPHAGAGASVYFSWTTNLGAAEIEVRAIQYPGRETRLRDPFITDAKKMVDVLANEWSAITGNRSCALYGHSMGALLGFELCQELARRSVKNPPFHLFLSGRNPPHLPLENPAIHSLPDREFLTAISTRYGNIPREIFTEVEFAEVFTPRLRADFTLVENYRWQDSGKRLRIPVTVLNGTSDSWINASRMTEWERYVEAPVELRWFTGGHFFHQQISARVMAAITATLRTSISDRLAVPSA